MIYYFWPDASRTLKEPVATQFPLVEKEVQERYYDSVDADAANLEAVLPYKVVNPASALMLNCRIQHHTQKTEQILAKELGIVVSSLHDRNLRQHLCLTSGGSLLHQQHAYEIDEVDPRRLSFDPFVAVRSDTPRKFPTIRSG